jgi:hypothetical protein
VTGPVRRWSGVDHVAREAAGTTAAAAAVTVTVGPLRPVGATVLDAVLVVGFGAILAGAAFAEAVLT